MGRYLILLMVLFLLLFGVTVMASTEGGSAVCHSIVLSDNGDMSNVDGDSVSDEDADFLPDIDSNDSNDDDSDVPQYDDFSFPDISETDQDAVPTIRITDDGCSALFVSVDISE